MPESKYRENKAVVLAWLTANPGFHTGQEIGVGCGKKRGAAMWAYKVCDRMVDDGLVRVDVKRQYAAR